MKKLKVIYNIIYALLFILVLAILAVVILQRVSNNNWSLGGFRIFNVVSESMVPKYNIGDVLLSKTVDVKDIKIGDDVVYRGVEQSYAGKIITHEVIDIQNVDGKIQFHTKGIANDLEDPVVSQEQILGLVMGKIPVLSELGKLMTNIYAFYFIIFIPLVLLIFVQIRRTVANLRDRDDDDEDDDDEDEDEEEKKKHGRRMK